MSRRASETTDPRDAANPATESITLSSVRTPSIWQMGSCCSCKTERLFAVDSDLKYLDRAEQTLEETTQPHNHRKV